MAINFDAYIAKAKKKDQEQYQQMVADTKQRAAAKTSSRSTDLAPVKTTAKPTDERTWFKKGSYFDDGYDFGDVTKTILGTVADVGENIGAGIIGMGEKAADALTVFGTAMSKASLNQANFNMMSSPLAVTKKGNAYASGLVAQSNAIQKATEKKASEVVASDLYDEEQIAKKIISAPFKEFTGMDVESASVFGEKSDSLVQSAGQLLATAGLNAVGVPWFLTTGATSFGAEAEGAFKEGATFEQGAMSAVVSAGAEILTEKLSGGIKFKLPGQEVAKTLDDILLKPLTEKISNKVVKALANFGIDALGEGGEEFISGIFSNLGSALYKDKKIGEILWSEEAWDEYIESFIGGAVLGGFSSTARAVASRNAIELDEKTQKVVDKELENTVAKEEPGVVKPEEQQSEHVEVKETGVVNHAEAVAGQQELASVNNSVPEDNSQTTEKNSDATPDEGMRVPIETKKQKLTVKAEAYQTEIDKNIQLRKETAAYYDEKISTAEEAYNALKNKHSKKADRLQRSIERSKRLKASAVADFEKRINEGQSRLDALNEELDKNPKKAERIEKYKEREAAKAAAEKDVVTKQYEEKRLQLQRDLNDDIAFAGNRALEMYEEIRNSQKGVKYSKELGYLRDLGFTYKDLKSTLLKVGRNPDVLLNPDSEIENEVRKAIGRDLEAAKQQLKNIDTDLKNELDRIESEAQRRVDAYQVANQRIIKQTELEGQMSELIGDTTTWKDKKLGIQYKVNTLRRNLRDIVRDEKGNRDIRKADAIYDELQGKYNHHEAQLNREANRIKKHFAKMKITKAEDTYIQMLGELKSNPDTKLLPEQVEEFYEKHKKQIDTEKVDKIIGEARELYNSLLDRVNETLSEHGMKEIPHRKGYFPHFTEDKQGVIAKLLNWKTQDNEIPTDIAGMTESFQPNRSWQAFNKRRTGDDTVYSFTKGLDIYLKGSLDWIYHIEDIQKRRAFENQIRYVHSDEGIKDKIDALKNNGVYDAEEFQKQLDLIYKEAENPLNNFVADFRTATNTLAGKKSTIDRTMEELTNRKVYSTMTNLYNRVSANMVAGSVSSALTNFIPITQSWGEVSPLSSVRALGETIVSAFRDDGTVDKSDFLTNRLRANENLNKTAWDRIGDAAGALMDVIDGITSQTVWRSKYNENISKGMGENEAIRNADRFAENVLAGRSRGNMPTIFDSKNPLFKTFTVFQLEVANQYGYMFKDMPQDVAEKSKLKLAKGYATMFLGAYVYNALYSSLAGRDAAFDPVGIVEDLLKDFGVVGKDGLLGEIKDLFDGEDDEEEEKEEFVLSETLSGFAKNVAEELPFVGGLLGGGRIPLDSALPYGTLNPIDAIKETATDKAEGNLKSITREWLKPVLYLALPLGGGQLKKTNEGLMMFSDDNPVAGSYTDSGSLRFPVEDTLGNRIQAAVFGQYASKNARTYFDEGLAPLKEKEIQEFIELDVPIADYWKYKEGLNNLKPEEGKKSVTNNQKGDYIGGLDFPVSKKNILINNLLDRDEPVDMTHYGKYEDFEEFDFATKNPELYKVLQREGVSVKEYKENEEKFVIFRNDDFSWAANNPEKHTVARLVSGNAPDFRDITEKLWDIEGTPDGEGGTVYGSEKKNRTEFIFNLDIEEGAKYLLFKSEYKNDNTYNKEVLDYIYSRRDINADERKALLKWLKFTIGDDGYIYWD